LDWQPFEAAMAWDTEIQQVTRNICIVDRPVCGFGNVEIGYH
jgi:hypothetical protein